MGIDGPFGLIWVQMLVPMGLFGCLWVLLKVMGPYWSRYVLVLMGPDKSSLVQIDPLGLG